MSDEYTPSEEEVQHGFASLVDWRYDQRVLEFWRMLAVRDEALRTGCAEVMRETVEEAMRAAYAADPHRYPNPAGLDSWTGMRAALDAVANKIEGK